MDMQGHSCGSVTLTPLAAVMCCGSAALLWRHASAITCLAAHQINANGLGEATHVVMCGCKDGCVLAWDVHSRQLRMRLHVHASAVRGVVAAHRGLIKDRGSQNPTAGGAAPFACGLGLIAQAELYAPSLSHHAIFCICFGVVPADLCPRWHPQKQQTPPAAKLSWWLS